MVYFVGFFYFQSLGYEVELYIDDDRDVVRYDYRDEIKRFVLMFEDQIFCSMYFFVKLNQLLRD